MRWPQIALPVRRVSAHDFGMSTETSWKPVITSELVRGILVAVFAQGAWAWGQILMNSLRNGQAGPIAWGLVGCLLQVAVCLALLCKTKRASKAAFIVLAMLTLLQVGSGIYWKLTFPDLNKFGIASPLTISFFMGAIISAALTAIAYGFHTRRFPEPRA